MALSGTMTYLIVFICVFALLMGILGSFASLVSQSLNAANMNQEVTIPDRFTAANLTAYNSSWTISNLVFGSSQMNQTSLPSGQMLEVWWDNDGDIQNGFFSAFELRHLDNNFLGFWIGWHRLEWTYKNGATIPVIPRSGAPDINALTRDVVVNAADSATNSSAFYAHCDHIKTSVIIQSYNSSWSIGQSWDNNHLKVYVSYDVDLSATSLNIWNIVGLIVGFTNPDLGIGGFMGNTLNAIIAITLWGIRLFIIAKFTLAIIPFIPGLYGD